jgi:hypothetical protein
MAWRRHRGRSPSTGEGVHRVHGGHSTRARVSGWQRCWPQQRVRVCSPRLEPWLAVRFAPLTRQRGDGGSAWRLCIIVERAMELFSTALEEGESMSRAHPNTMARWARGPGLSIGGPDEVESSPDLISPGMSVGPSRGAPPGSPTPGCCCCCCRCRRRYCCGGRRWSFGWWP